MSIKEHDKSLEALGMKKKVIFGKCPQDKKYNKTTKKILKMAFQTKTV